MDPNRSRAVSMTRSASSSLPMLAATHWQPWPMSAAASSHASGLREQISTWAPASANAVAMPLPMPFEPPVTMAVLPSKRRSMDGAG